MAHSFITGMLQRIDIPNWKLMKKRFIFASTWVKKFHRESPTKSYFQDKNDSLFFQIFGASEDDLLKILEAFLIWNALTTLRLILYLLERRDSDPGRENFCLLSQENQQRL